MNLWQYALAFAGNVTFAPWSQWWNSAVGPARMPQGTPPMDYVQRTQPELLALFSDSIGPGGVTPRTMRDFVASTVTVTPGGSPPTAPLPLPGWTTATRPVGMIGPSIGYNYDSHQLEIWDDRAQTWVNPSFNGGTVTNPVIFSGGIILNPLPPSCSGQATGTLWNNGRIVGICP